MLARAACSLTKRAATKFARYLHASGSFMTIDEDDGMLLTVSVFADYY